MDVRVKNLSVSYGENKIFEDLSITFKEGQVTGIIGPNGSGKSTLLKCIYRVVRPSEGNVFFNEYDISRISYKKTAQETAVLMQQHENGIDLTVQDIVLMGRTPYKGITEGNNENDYCIADTAMKEAGIYSYREIRFSCLSGGEQQRVLLARAFAQQTPCLILDEPTNHLDITYQLKIMDHVCKSGKTVIAAIHDLNIAAMYCDRVIALKDGEIHADGTPEQVFTPQCIQHLYGIGCEVFLREDGRPAIIYKRGHM